MTWAGHISVSARRWEGLDFEMVPDLPCDLRHIVPWSRFPHPYTKGGKIGLIVQFATSPTAVSLCPLPAPQWCPNTGGVGAVLSAPEWHSLGSVSVQTQSC